MPRIQNLQFSDLGHQSRHVASGDHRKMETPVRVFPILDRFGEVAGVLRVFGHNIYTMPPYIITPDELTSVTTAMVELAQGSSS